MRLLAILAVAFAVPACAFHNGKLRNAELVLEGATIAGGIIATSTAPQPTTYCVPSNSLFSLAADCSTSSPPMRILGPLAIVAGIAAIITTLATGNEEAPPPAPAPLARVQPPAPRVPPPLDVTSAWATAQRYTRDHGIPFDRSALRVTSDGANHLWTFSDGVTTLAVQPEGTLVVHAE
jgi:hypothetical protein